MLREAGIVRVPSRSTRCVCVRSLESWAHPGKGGVSECGKPPTSTRNKPIISDCGRRVEVVVKSTHKPGIGYPKGKSQKVSFRCADPLMDFRLMYPQKNFPRHVRTKSANAKKDYKKTFKCKEGRETPPTNIPRNFLQSCERRFLQICFS